MMLDLNDCNPEILDDLGACFNLFNELPEMIGMTKITQPYVFRYSVLIPEDEGITGVAEEGGTSDDGFCSGLP